MKNKLIVFEGIDGSGKTTLTKMLNQRLNDLKIKSIRLEDLENKKIGFNLIKPFIKSQADINSSLFFYIASAINKSQKIQNLLKDSWVICDRYVYSTLAYHKLRGANMKLIPDLKLLPIIKPDYYFLITCHEKTRRVRLEKKGTLSPEDQVPKSKGSLPNRTEAEYKKFKPIIIDNSKSIDDSLSQILNYLPLK
ncbi:MAG: dTMP kinase [Candidatus Buchananbacteria bacterium]